MVPPNVNGNGADVNGVFPGPAIRFRWQFPRNRPQVANFETDTSGPERSPSLVHQPTGRNVGSGIPSPIHVRSEDEQGTSTL